MDHVTCTLYRRPLLVTGSGWQRRWHSDGCLWSTDKPPEVGYRYDVCCGRWIRVKQATNWSFRSLQLPPVTSCKPANAFRGIYCVANNNSRTVPTLSKRIGAWVFLPNSPIPFIVTPFHNYVNIFVHWMFYSERVNVDERVWKFKQNKGKQNSFSLAETRWLTVINLQALA